MVTAHDREICDLYRRFHPECKDMGYEEVMMMRGLGYRIMPDPLPEPEKEKVVKVKKEKVRPYTEKQYRKLCEDIRKDAQGDMDVLKSAGEWDSICYDLAESLLKNCLDKRLEAYFISNRVDKKFWIEAFACDIHGEDRRKVK